MIEVVGQDVTEPVWPERLYIHGDAFRLLATESLGAAFDVSLGLAVLQAARIYTHQFDVDVELGAVSLDDAVRQTAWAVDAREKYTATLLRRTGYTPNVPYRAGPCLPMLAAGHQYLVAASRRVITRSPRPRRPLTGCLPTKCQLS
jgi:hypothetical protein